jgi:hypothetical protein
VKEKKNREFHADFIDFKEVPGPRSTHADNTNIPILIPEREFRHETELGEIGFLFFSIALSIY